ncbi:hypothetical protein CHS0354_011180 [Potamilus streckersoni]|uniref:Uncharacterized protein n=1 Tax=Potamilus streckersoni TaxID=2493646 RepID=A0AAE0VMP0_9BIVA|nr:hypothetical protein CHS0354_011180 [Potamilus streckersoni]
MVTWITHHRHGEVHYHNRTGFDHIRHPLMLPSPRAPRTPPLTQTTDPGEPTATRRPAKGVSAAYFTVSVSSGRACCRLCTVNGKNKDQRSNLKSGRHHSPYINQAQLGALNPARVHGSRQGP